MLLKYALQKGYIAITTSSRRDRLVEYLEAVNSLLQLSFDEIEEIDEKGKTEIKRKYWTQFMKD